MVRPGNGVSFTNEYNWGDFKGDPDKLMERYFDAHVYVANWMTAIFMVRLPIEALPKETAKAMALALRRSSPPMLMKSNPPYIFPGSAQMKSPALTD